MTFQEAIEHQQPIERIRWLCSDDNPDAETREGYRALMIRRATGQPDLPMPQPVPVLSTSLAQEFTAPAQQGAIAFVPQGCGGCGSKAIEPPAGPVDTDQP